MAFGWLLHSWGTFTFLLSDGKGPSTVTLNDKGTSQPGVDIPGSKYQLYEHLSSPQTLWGGLHHPPASLKHTLKSFLERSCFKNQRRWYHPPQNLPGAETSHEDDQRAISFLTVTSSLDLGLPTFSGLEKIPRLSESGSAFPVYNQDSSQNGHVCWELGFAAQLWFSFLPVKDLWWKPFGSLWPTRFLAKVPWSGFPQLWQESPWSLRPDIRQWL